MVSRVSFVYNKETGESQNWVSHEMMRSTQFRNCTEILELSRGPCGPFFFCFSIHGDFFLNFGRKKLLSLTFILSVGYGPVTVFRVNHVTCHVPNETAPNRDRPPYAGLSISRIYLTTQQDHNQTIIYVENKKGIRWPPAASSGMQRWTFIRNFSRFSLGSFLRTQAEEEGGRDPLVKLFSFTSCSLVFLR